MYIAILFLSMVLALVVGGFVALAIIVFGAVKVVTALCLAWFVFLLLYAALGR